MSRSAEKRYRQSVKAKIANRIHQKRARNLQILANKQITNADNAAKSTARLFGASIDKAAQKGGLHKRTAARLKSRMNKKILQLH